MVFKLIIHGDVDGAILKKDWRLHLMNNKSNIDSATLRMTTKSYNFIILLTKDLKVSLRMTMQSNCLIKKKLSFLYEFLYYSPEEIFQNLKKPHLRPVMISISSNVFLLYFWALSLASWISCHKCNALVSPRDRNDQNSPSVTVP